MTLLRWNQEIDGIPLLEGTLRAAVTNDGRLVNITGGAHPDLPRPGKPSLDEDAAIAAAAKATGARPDDRAEADLVMTAATGDVRLAWRVLRPQGQAYYDQLIDARTGAELARRDRIDHAVPGLVYDNYPGAAGRRHGARGRPRSPTCTRHHRAPRPARPRVGRLQRQRRLRHRRADPQGRPRDFKYPRSSFTLDPKCPAGVGCAWRHDHVRQLAHQPAARPAAAVRAARPVRRPPRVAVDRLRRLQGRRPASTATPCSATSWTAPTARTASRTTSTSTTPA